MERELSEVISKILRIIILWAKESFIRSLTVVLTFFILVLPLIEYLQGIVKNFPYMTYYNFVSDFARKNFGLRDYLNLTILILVFICLIFIYRKLRKNWQITENFNSDLNSWSIPLNSGWTIQDCDDSLGKMLSVTNSGYPGTLKEAYGWYDYEISFLSKIDGDVPSESQNLSVVVRSENNLNGVMIQITKTHVRPHLLFNGTYIVDRDKIEQLPTVLRVNKWIPVKIIVRGNIIEIELYNFKLQYRIPTNIYEVESHLLQRTVTLQEIEQNYRKISQRMAFLAMRLKEIEQIKDEDTKKKEHDLISKDIEALPSTTKVILEFQKGSVGLRESGGEHTFYRNFVVKKI